MDPIQQFYRQAKGILYSLILKFLLMVVFDEENQAFDDLIHEV